MTKSKKPGGHREPRIKPDGLLERSALTQEQNSSKPAGGTQEEVSDDKSEDKDASQDFIGPKGMDT